MYIRKQNDLGFTLVELLIALALSLIVLSAVLGIFNSSSLSYNVQEDVASVQQDVRVGKVFIERDARMAGAGLIDYPPIADLEPGDLIGITIKNNFGVNGSDEITMRYITPEPDSCGDPPPSAGVDDIPCSSLPPLTTRFGPNGTAAPITSSTIYADGISGSGWDGNCYCGDELFNLTNNSSGSSLMAIIIGIDLNTGEEAADKIIIEQVMPSSSKINNNPSSDYSDPNKVANEYDAGSTVMFFTFKPVEMVRYYITADGTLMREYDADLSDASVAPRTDQIVEHIEDMQFAFGLDLEDENGDPGQDGVVDTWRGDDAGDVFVQVTDPDTGETYWDLPTDEKGFIRTIRISLLGRTDKARRELSPGTRSALEDHDGATEEDYFRRRLSQVEVELRNVALAIAE